MKRKAPGAANWLLTRLGVTGSNPSLAGDLQEEWERGRSSGWYWRQTISAACTGTYTRAAPLTRNFLAQVAISAILFHFRIPRQFRFPGGWLLLLAAFLIFEAVKAICLGLLEGCGEILQARADPGEKRPRACASTVSIVEAFVRSVPGWRRAGKGFWRYLELYCVLAILVGFKSWSVFSAAEITWFLLLMLDTIPAKRPRV